MKPLRMLSGCRRRRAGSSLVLLAVLFVGFSDRRAAAEVPDSPFAAHNAYPWRFYGGERLHRALKAGLKHIELDLTYDPKREAVVVTHDSEPRGGEPTLGELLEPVCKQWGAADDDGYTLILDFKTSSLELARGVHTELAKHADLLSKMPKRDLTRFIPGKITVCLTGNSAGHRAYLEQVAGDGQLLAFGDYQAVDWRADTALYVPTEPAGFVRFVTYHQRVFMDSAKAHGNDHISAKRLEEVVRLANERGYRMRIYTLNPLRSGEGRDYRYWEACATAGVPMIATDAYELSAKWWAQRLAKAGAER